MILVFLSEKELIEHAHHCDDATHNSADAGEKCDPTLSIALFNFDVQRRYFVKEKYPWQTAIRTRIYMSQVFSN